jgi:hypothetical protein
MLPKEESDRSPADSKPPSTRLVPYLSKGVGQFASYLRIKFNIALQFNVVAALGGRHALNSYICIA